MAGVLRFRASFPRRTTRSDAMRKRNSAGPTGFKCGKKFWKKGSRSSLVHVLDIGLENEQIRRTFAIDLQTAFVIPLDDAFNEFSILQDEYHWRLGLHLLHVIEIFCVGLIGWSGFFLMIITPVHLVLHFVQGRSY